MMRGKIMIRIGLLAGLVALSSACSSASRFRIPKNPDPIIKGETTQEKAERALQMKLSKQITFLEGNKEQYKKQVVKIPSGQESFYCKYYDEFPEGSENVRIMVASTEQFSPLYTAQVKYRKVHYQTRYTKSASRAADDTDFIRDEGIQNDEYEFDGAIWHLTSSIFEVTRTSVYRKDRWTTTQDRVKRLEEEEPELFVDKVRTLFGLLE